MKRLLLIGLCLLLLLSSVYPVAFCEEFSFEGVFLAEGEEPIVTANSYRSCDVSITIETEWDTELKTDITVADVYVRSLECFRRDFGDDAWGKGSLSVKKFAAKTGAPLVLSGDSSAAIKDGLVVANGTVWRNTVSSKRDVAVLWKNGVMECFTQEEMISEDIYSRTDEIWHTFLFGPMLLQKDGSAIENKKDFSYADVFTTNPRSAIGYIEPGHYVLVLVAGRKTKSVVESKKKNYGADLSELSQIMYRLGCKAAYNLDGGQSAVMWFGDGVVTAMYNNGRPVGDAVIICDRE